MISDWVYILQGWQEKIKSQLLRDLHILASRILPPVWCPSQFQFLNSSDGNTLLIFIFIFMHLSFLVQLFSNAFAPYLRQNLHHVILHKVLYAWAQHSYLSQVSCLNDNLNSYQEEKKNSNTIIPSYTY